MHSQNYIPQEKNITKIHYFVSLLDFLGVRLDLINNTYQRYRKPNKETVYINKHSNHPPNILKELPKAINKRITNISCNQDILMLQKHILTNKHYATVVLIKN